MTLRAVLAAIRTPTWVVPGTDARHPTELAERVVRVLGDGHLAPVSVSSGLRTADGPASAIAPALRVPGRLTMSPRTVC
ncbi:hypothetical protein [Streptosporangium saharense]|uniref:hypothetical protein n=1 Tax=Streptosporangium saharense TaxID=1706840 RepID=UPI00332B5B07